MKIIKNTMEEPRTIECPHCKSVLAFDYKDIKREESSGFSGFLFTQKLGRYLICAVCKRDINLEIIEFLSESEENENAE